MRSSNERPYRWKRAHNTKFPSLEGMGKKKKKTVDGDVPGE
jgi:hypothetical protein